MKLKSFFLIMMLTVVTALAGCEPLLVLDPKGPQAERQASDIIRSIGIMSFIVIVVFAILIFVLIKYRASKQSPDYNPPHMEGKPWVEGIVLGIPVLIVAYLSFVSVQSNYIVESTPKGYEDKKPLVIYASSSNWKWHFSYPEEEIETVNYLYIPTDRPIDFKLYSYGPITSFWIPQLGGQKYAMSDMTTTLHLLADEPGEMIGKNANFSGKGTAENTFNVTAMSPTEFMDWVKEVKETAKPITKDKFNELLKPGHLGQMTFTGTHLGFSPAPEHKHNTEKVESNKQSGEMNMSTDMEMDMNMDMDMSTEHSHHYKEIH